MPVQGLGQLVDERFRSWPIGCSGQREQHHVTVARAQRTGGRAGRVAQFAHREHDPLPGLRADPNTGRRVEHVAHGGSGYAGEPGDVGTGGGFGPRLRASSVTPRAASDRLRARHLDDTPYRTRTRGGPPQPMSTGSQGRAIRYRLVSGHNLGRNRSNALPRRVGRYKITQGDESVRISLPSSLEQSNRYLVALIHVVDPFPCLFVSPRLPTQHFVSRFESSVQGRNRIPSIGTVHMVSTTTEASGSPRHRHGIRQRRRAHRIQARSALRDAAHRQHRAVHAVAGRGGLPAPDAGHPHQGRSRPGSAQVADLWGALFATIGNPLFGKLSDITRSRFGRARRSSMFLRGRRRRRPVLPGQRELDRGRGSDLGCHPVHHERLSGRGDRGHAGSGARGKYGRFSALIGLGIPVGTIVARSCWPGST